MIKYENYNRATVDFKKDISHNQITEGLTSTCMRCLSLTIIDPIDILVKSPVDSRYSERFLLRLKVNDRV